MVTQEGFVQTTTFLSFHNIDIFGITRHFGQRVFTGVIHGGGGGHWRWIEGLYLIGTETILFQPDRQVHHVVVGGARMRRDEIRNQILFLAGFLAEAIKHLLEAVIGTNTGLHHLR